MGGGGDELLLGRGGGGGGGVRKRKRTDILELPEGCIANAVALTTPRNACTLSSVSSVFKLAAESDAVWRRLLPADIHDVMSRRSIHSNNNNSPAVAEAHSPPSYSSLKELYLFLCDNPILVDGGKLSFSLCKRSGKKCYMISARALSIAWGDTPRYWYWTSTPNSRFGEVAQLNIVCWLEICGKIRLSLLSPATLYAAYIVFKGTPDSHGFACQPVDVKVGLVGGEATERSVYLNGGGEEQYYYAPPAGNNEQPYNLRGVISAAAPHSRRNTALYQYILQFQTSNAVSSSSAAVAAAVGGKVDVLHSTNKERHDGWSEVELGEFFIEGGGCDDGEVEISVSEVKVCNWKRGLIVKGIEIRPKGY